MENKSWIGVAVLSLVMQLAGQSLPAKKPNQMRLAVAQDGSLRKYANCERLISWQSGHLLGYEFNQTRSPRICLLDKFGRLERLNFSLPEAAIVQIDALALSQGGELAVSGAAVRDDGAVSGFISRISLDRRSQRVTQVGRYAPEVLTFGPDRNIWTIGWIRDDQDRIIENNIMRRYDSSGAVLSSVRVKVKPVVFTGDATNQSSLVASKDRVAWLTRSNEYFEFASDGSEIMHVPGPIESDRDLIGLVAGLGVDWDTNRVVGLIGFERSEMVLALFDRQSRNWSPIDLSATALRFAWLLGLTGESVMITTDRQSCYEYKLEPVTVR